MNLQLLQQNINNYNRILNSSIPFSALEEGKEYILYNRLYRDIPTKIKLISIHKTSGKVWISLYSPPLQTFLSKEYYGQQWYLAPLPS